MWGNIVTEVTYQPNFNINFSNTKSEVLIHLSQWQYWWWFWFCFVWVLYFFIILRLVRNRTLKFNPKIASTFRPHGKWGDLLVCMLPVSWCLNILINSNFLLKLIEWQTESSLFTVRIRGKQWYWVYKYDVKDISDIFTAPKNIGRNKWVVNNYNTISSSDVYTDSLKLRAQNRFFKKYWSELSGKINKAKYLKYKSSVSSNIPTSLTNNYPTDKNTYSLFFENSFFLKNKQSFFKEDSFLLNFYESISNSPFKIKSLSKSFTNLFFYEGSESGWINHSDLLENSRFFKRYKGASKPLRILKNSKLNFDEEFCEIFSLRFNLDSENIVHKNPTNNIYFILKQKRYNRRKLITSRFKYATNDEGLKLIPTKLAYKNKPFLSNKLVFNNESENYTRKYRMVKKSKNRFDETSVLYNKRLLRTSKTLVLPAHVNITAITNSYDVIHSWFIPGLGLKLDCIPGRATHHTFFIDNVGFYYGQCAEVCGRYHHHMPIRLCALPFEHFLVWWHSFGLPKVIFSNAKKRNTLSYGFRKFTW